MDVALYRSRAPRLREWPNTHKLVGLRPLSRVAIEDATAAVEQEWNARDLPLGTAFHSMAETAAILAEALCYPQPPWRTLGDASAISRSTTPAELRTLGAMWFEVQEASIPDQQQLLAELELRLSEGDPLTLINGINASQCDNAGQFYNDELHVLTDGQLIYYYSLQIVHYRANEKGTKTRCKSLKILRQQAGRSESTNPTEDTSPKSTGPARIKRWA